MSENMNNKPGGEQLLQHIQQETSKRCDEIVQRTSAKAHQLITQAYAQARKKLAIAIANERQLLDDELRQANAELQTEKRLYQQQREQQLLQQSEKQLHSLLQLRWESADTRKQWIDKSLAQAVTKFTNNTLRGKPWHIQHAQLSEAEIDDIEHYIHTQAGTNAEFNQTDSISAGLLISCAGVTLDSSTEGLTRDQKRIHGRLLAILQSTLDDPLKGSPSRQVKS